MNEAIQMEDSREFDFSCQSGSLAAAEASMEEIAAARAEQYLKQVERLDRRIDRKIRLQDDLKDLITRKSRYLSALPRGKGDFPGSAEERVIDLEQEINQEINHLANLKEEIWELLSRMENQEVALMLDDRYISRLTVQQVADRAGYCRRHAQRLLHWGLLELDRLMREENPMHGYFPQ